MAAAEEGTQRHFVDSPFIILRSGPESKYVFVAVA
jgi:hypothetical protein